MIYTVTLNPAVDKIARLNAIKIQEVNRVTKIETDAGGKGINVSRTVKCLQSSSVATGFLGGSTGNFVENLLLREEIDVRMISIIGNTRTNLKIIDHENQMTEFNEEGPFILQNEFDELMDYLNECLDLNSILVISGSMPKGLSRSTIANLIELARENGSTVFLDIPLHLLRDAMEAKPSIVRMGKKELAAYFNDERELSEVELLGYMKQLINDGIEMVVVHDYGQIAYVASASHIYKCLAQSVEVKTMVGAGDAFVGGFVVGLESKLEMIPILQLACGCYSAATCSKNARPMDLAMIKELTQTALIEIIE